MQILRWSAQMLENASPAGIIIGGTALALSLPIVRKGLRCAAVATARAVISVIDEAKTKRMTSPDPKEATA